MKRYFAYVRVSTKKQATHGSSPQEQRAAIEAYAQRNGLTIEQWFQEEETAAKQGRRLFTQMVALLNKGKAHGVLIHKIDRSARNLRDWTAVGDLTDRGIEVHFVHEHVDMTSRGGRLAADIQAVVAADYIRNLRDEVRKGFYGRLKQGLYPLPAFLGYLDQGTGKAKILDPDRSSLVKLGFELYATGRYTLDTLDEETYRRGLRNKLDSRVGRNGWSRILGNEFYKGTIHIRRTDERFPGIHQPLVAASLFDRVQDVLHGRTKHRGLKHAYQFQKTVRCATCDRVFVPELQKGHIYYRCHGKGCKGVCVREEFIAELLSEALSRVTLTDDELEDLRLDYTEYMETVSGDRIQEKVALELQLSAIDARLARLTDAYIDRLIEKDIYEERKQAVLNERALRREAVSNLEAGSGTTEAKLRVLFELLKSLKNQAGLENAWERRDLLKSTCSNLHLREKSLVVTWVFPFDVLANRDIRNDSGPSRYRCRTGTGEPLFVQILNGLKDQCGASSTSTSPQVHKSASN